MIVGIDKYECEHYVDKQNRLVTIYSGVVYFDLDMPDIIYQLRKKELRDDVDAQHSLYRMGIFDIQQMVLQFCKCRYGGYDSTPDTLVHGTSGSKPDYWNCGKRGNCKEEFCLCRPIITENGKLSPAEIRVLKLIAEDLADKQIADILQVTENTIHTQRYSLTKKIGCASKNGLVAFAYENGIKNN